MRTAVTLLTVDSRESCSWREAESPSEATQLSDSLDKRVPPKKSGAILHRVAYTSHSFEKGLFLSVEMPTLLGQLSIRLFEYVESILKVWLS